MSHDGSSSTPRTQDTTPGVPPAVSPVSAEQTADHPEALPLATEQPCVPSQPAAPAQQPAAMGQQPSVVAHQPASTGQQPVATGQDSAVLVPQASAQGQQPPVMGQAPIASVPQAPAIGQQPAIPTQHPAVPAQQPAMTSSASVPGSFAQPSPAGEGFEGATQSGYAAQPGMPAIQGVPSQQMASQEVSQRAPQPKKKGRLLIVLGIVLLVLVLLGVGAKLLFDKSVDATGSGDKRSTTQEAKAGSESVDDLKVKIADELQVNPYQMKLSFAGSPEPQNLENGVYKQLQIDVELPFSAFTKDPNEAISSSTETVPVTMVCEDFDPGPCIAKKIEVSYTISPEKYAAFSKASVKSVYTSSVKLIDGGVHMEQERTGNVAIAYDLMMSLLPDGKIKMEPKNGTMKTSSGTEDLTSELNKMYPSDGSQPFNMELGTGPLKYTEFKVSASGILVKRTGEKVKIDKLRARTGSKH